MRRRNVEVVFDAVSKYLHRMRRSTQIPASQSSFNVAKISANDILYITWYQEAKSDPDFFPTIQGYYKMKIKRILFLSRTAVRSQIQSYYNSISLMIDLKHVDKHIEHYIVCFIIKPVTLGKPENIDTSCAAAVHKKLSKIIYHL